MTGHCSAIGIKTGKVVGYSVRSKRCRACKTKKGKDHDCRLNWAGSAKAMEPDMVAGIIQDISKKGVETKAIIGDDDTSTIARIHSSVDKNIQKRSDMNHVKKTLSNNLFKLQKICPELTTKVIRYFQKLFSYNISQNKSDPSELCKGLDAIPRHPFGEHSFCEERWCKFLHDPAAKFRSLPYGKPLRSKKLQNALIEIFTAYKKQSGKLCSLGSTQANESLNKLIATKAPKSQHYSGSASLNFRVAASVAQKNAGNLYVTNVRYLFLHKLQVHRFVFMP